MPDTPDPRRELWQTQLQSIGAAQAQIPLPPTHLVASNPIPPSVPSAQINSSNEQITDGEFVNVKVGEPTTKINRPPNMFILYRAELHRRIKAGTAPPISESDRRNAGGIYGKAVANRWNAEPTEVRYHWAKKAEEVIVQHKKDHPHYRFQPVQKSRRKRLTVNSNVTTWQEEGLEAPHRVASPPHDLVTAKMGDGDQHSYPHQHIPQLPTTGYAESDFYYGGGLPDLPALQVLPQHSHHLTDGSFYDLYQDYPSDGRDYPSSCPQVLDHSTNYTGTQFDVISGADYYSPSGLNLAISGEDYWPRGEVGSYTLAGYGTDIASSAWGGTTGNMDQVSEAFGLASTLPLSLPPLLYQPQGSWTY